MQVAIFHFLSMPLPVASTTPRSTEAVILAAEMPPETMEKWMSVVRDPAYLALASRQGFSDGTWTQVNRPDHGFADWSESPSYLARDTRNLGKSAPSRPDGPRVWAATRIERPAEQGLAEGNKTPFSQKSAVRVEGPLAGRPLAAPMLIPEISAAELTASTVVEAFVTPSGSVFSSRLLGSSGVKEVDQVALNLVRGSQFEALPGAKPISSGTKLTSGRFIFDWVALASAPAAPNSPK